MCVRHVLECPYWMPHVIGGRYGELNDMSYDTMYSGISTGGKLINRQELSELLKDYEYALRIGATHKDYLDFIHLYPGKYRLEFPSGEVNNPNISGFLWVWRMKNALVLGLPITGKERFNAQGLEGKCAVDTDITGALMAWRELPEHRVAVYEVK